MQKYLSAEETLITDKLKKERDIYKRMVLAGQKTVGKDEMWLSGGVKVSAKSHTCSYMWALLQVKWYEFRKGVNK